MEHHIPSHHPSPCPIRIDETYACMHASLPLPSPSHEPSSSMMNPERPERNRNEPCQNTNVNPSLRESEKLQPIGRRNGVWPWPWAITTSVHGKVTMRARTHARTHAAHKPADRRRQRRQRPTSDKPTAITKTRQKEEEGDNARRQRRRRRRLPQRRRSTDQLYQRPIFLVVCLSIHHLSLYLHCIPHTLS